MSASAQLCLFELGVDMAGLRAAREALRSVSRAPLTAQGYASDWRVFSRWCVDCGREAFPATAETVELYCTWLLVEQGRRASTAARHVAGIVFEHRRRGSAVPDMGGARQVLCAVRRQRKERPAGKVALEADDLVLVARACVSKTNAGARDRALIVLGFATSLRRSELARLQLSDVSFDPRGVVVLVRHSKRDQEGKGRVLGVWAGKRAVTDPVRVVKAWLAKRGDWPGPLFCRVQTGDVLVSDAISGDSVNDAVKRAVGRAGLDPAAYGAHSLRAGAVTSSAALGRADSEIMRMSGHSSASVMRQYIRHARLFTGRNPLAGVL